MGFLSNAIAAATSTAAVVAGLAAVAPPAVAAQGDLTRVSVSTSGAQANGTSSDPVASASGRFVAFTSEATNLAPSDTNGRSDVFLRDLTDKTTVRVSVGQGGAQANGDSWGPSMSTDGRYIAFTSTASNLVAGDTNGVSDVFIRDMQTGTTTRASTGSGVSGSSRDPSISGDGRIIAFLTADGSTPVLRWLATATNDTILTLRDGGAPLLSSNGRYLVVSRNPYDGPIYSKYDVQQRTFGDIGGWGTPVGLTADGVRVLINEDLRGTATDRYRVSDGSTSRDVVVINDDEPVTDLYLTGGAISADAKVIAYGIAGSPLEERGVFVEWDGTRTVRVDKTASGQVANGAGGDPAVSGDGRVVVFASEATNLVPGDTNQKSDLFAKELWNKPTRLFADTFTQADGSAWGAAWTRSVSNGSLTVQGNAGRMRVSNVSGAFARAQLTGAAAVSDTDLLTSFQWDSGAAGASFAAYVRGSGGWANSIRPKNGVGVELSSASKNVVLKRVVNGTATTLATTAGQSVGTGRQWLRVQAVGGQVRYRIWPYGTPEPLVWSGSTAIGATVPAGRAHLSLVRASTATAARQITLDSVSLNSLAPQVPPAS